MSRLLPTVLSVVVAAASSAVGEEWRFDRLHLPDGEVLEGLLRSENAQTIDFAVILRPPGRPMQAVVRPYRREQVARLERLDDQQRRVLTERFEQLRGRARIEADRMEALSLNQTSLPGGGTAWQYRGPWFVLETTLDEAAARRCIVRVEQVFRAYRHLIAPQRDPSRPLKILITGSMDEYRQRLQQKQLPTNSPALYLPGENLILAGSDLAPLARQMAAVRKEHEELQSRQEQRLQEFPQQFAEVSRQLREKGYTATEIADEKRARQAALQREAKSLHTQIAEAERRNDAQFAARIHRTFGRLYHESFHAYLENHVMQGASEVSPRWLNEGLAQIFEHGQLDGDVMRIDEPDRQLLRQLQDDLKRGDLELTDLLQATASDFHTSNKSAPADRLYLYSWGVTYYLLFEQETRIDRLLPLLLNPQQTPAAGLVRLAGRPLDVFELDWRQAMLEF